jgi:hypothetical protein
MEVGENIIFYLSEEGPHDTLVVREYSGTIMRPSLLEGKWIVRRDKDGKEFSIRESTIGE